MTTVVSPLKYKKEDLAAVQVTEGKSDTRNKELEKAKSDGLRR
jgi:hypothetical protein